ncbi:MAG: replicative DNA helicase [Candidatus Berkelbacteria bacterium]|nr:replicative DNA helicase [Candidatus Berkelbacteria bacterium]
MADQLSKIPPQNIEAEQSVLGSLLLDKDAVIKVADILTSDDFYKDAHGDIYDAVLDLYQKRMPVDIVTLTDQLEKDKKLENIGGASYLTTLVNCVPSATRVVHYAKIVQQKATLRRLIQAASKTLELGYQEDKDIESVLDEAERNIFSISKKFMKQSFVHVKDILGESFERIDKLSKHKGMLRGVPTGFDQLDNLLSGLQPSDLIILAGRPSMGKSSFASSIILNAAVEAKVPVGFFSIEMSKEQVVDRFLCGQAGINSWKLRSGNLEQEDFPKIGHAIGVLSEAPIFIDDSTAVTPIEIMTKSRRLQSEHGLGLIVVDYLQMMYASGRRAAESRVQEVSQISLALKSLARELNVPVIAVSQLSRAVEHRDSKIPQLSDLRESGSLEQDADVVIFIYRDEYYNKETERKNITDILVKKHRNGPTGEVELYFIPEQMRFTNLEKKRAE